MKSYGRWTKYISTVILLSFVLCMCACKNNKAVQNTEKQEIESEVETIENAQNVQENTTKDIDNNIEENTKENSEETVEESEDAQYQDVEDEQNEYAENDTAAYSENAVYEEDSSKTQQQEVTQNIVICIDPGHGGSEEGTKETYDNQLIMEKNLNGRIASSLKTYLEQYENVSVVITHSVEENMSLSERMDFAVANDAKYFISVHVNSKSTDEVNSTGCMAIMSCSRYQPSNSKVDSLYDTELALSNSIISKLNSLGLPAANDMNVQNTGGILQRPTTTGTTYPDGSTADYYGLIYKGTYAGIPTVIVEHAFLSNESDYRNYLCTDNKLDVLAKADAEAIMAVIR